MDLEKYLQSNNKTHLIFDFDCTLVELSIPWETWAEGDIKAKLQKLDAKILSQFTNGLINLSDLQNQYVEKFGDEIKKDIIDYNTKFEAEFNGLFKVNKPLIEQVRHLENFKMYIWSSNTKPTITNVLDKLHLSPRFEKIVSRSDLSMIKPYTEGFKFIDEPGVDRKNYLFIGDSESDMKAAKSLGLDFFRITYFGDNLKGKR